MSFVIVMDCRGKNSRIEENNTHVILNILRVEYSPEKCVMGMGNKDTFYLSHVAGAGKNVSNSKIFCSCCSLLVRHE